MGIAVSDDGRIYLGTNKSIFVCNEARGLDPIINTASFRGYCLTVQDDHLIVARSKMCYVYSLDGLLLQKEESDGALFRELNRSLYAPIEHNGTRYQMKNILGYQYITKTNPAGNASSVVYQTPIGFYLLCVLLVISFVVFGLSVITVVIASRFKAE